MVNEWDITIPCLTGGRLRKISVYVPDDYECTGRRYPVMYMFDGQNVFFDEEATYGKSWGMGEYLDGTHTKIIVAAVECDTKGNGRLSEYSPVDFWMKEESALIPGRGRIYMDWLVNDFKPFIDANFRTLPSRANTAIAGSSMGGLMSLYAVCEYNRVFSRAAALSPSLWVNGGNMPEFLRKARFGANTNIYMDYGSREFSNHSKQRELFGAAAAMLVKKGAFATTRVVPYGTHCEASWQKQIPYFMNALGFTGE
ncbi:MAG: alpha/beta hydrolase [Clostridia bacterium]|nr:alpha/beta hydrolase [Clostridia bacterium]